jgi:hypothetical protein
VEPPECPIHLFENGADVGGLGDIACEREDFYATAGQFVADLPNPIRLVVDHHDGGAERGESPGDRPPDAGTAAGY